MVKAKIGTAEKIAEKWLEVTPGRSNYYESGVRDPDEDWETNTVAAGPAFKAAMSAVDIVKRFVGGAKKVGTAKWQRKSLDLGVGRFGPGVLAGGDDFKDGFAPFVPVIAAVEMPARKPRGDPGNYDRGKAIGDALHKKRLALIGAGAK